MSTTKQHVIKAQRGDSSAFGELYEELYDKVYGFCYKRCFNHHACADITSNTFVKLIENLPKFTWINEPAFYGWVFRIASSEVSNYFRKQDKYDLNTEYFDDDTCDLFSEIKQSTAVHEVDAVIDAQRLHASMKKLKKKDRRIVELFYFADMAHKDIGELEGMNEGAVRTACHRALTKLKKHMNVNKLHIEERSTS